MPRVIQYQPDQARRVLIAANPSAGSGANRSAIERLREELVTAGLEAEITSDLDLVARQGADPVGAGLRAVVAAGGDRQLNRR